MPAGSMWRLERRRIPGQPASWEPRNLTMSREPTTASALRTARFEVGALIVTGGLHLVFESLLRAKMIFMPLAVVFWLAYLAKRLAREKGLLREWGFRRDNLGEAFKLATVAFILCLAAIAILTWALGHSLRDPRMLPIAVVYPIWGLAQQFLLQALLAANVRRLTGSAVAATIVAATLFGAVHAPDWTLCGLTFSLALLFVPLYLRVPNLWPLGLFHGWLGTLAYYGVLGRDAWAAFLGASPGG